ncbi:MAG: mobile mystery protein A [Acidimicrobiales bacterium]|nr:mobile mystery protein A [Acidimicrobiales bacterium]MYD84132.1 mobile mystery protein A [Acidimicrobiales bacterium]MYJ65277.1 mobile mystery protein A [Acidimicrobiales bacterium]
MKSQRAVARNRLDARLASVPELARPNRGWIRALRDALGMSSADLARRMGISQQRVPAIERGEQDMTIKLDTLMRAADALDCELVYALVPRTSLDGMVRDQARRQAAGLLRRVTQHSRLEDQRPTDADLAEQVEELAAELADKRGLWNDAQSR